MTATENGPPDGRSDGLSDGAPDGRPDGRSDGLSDGASKARLFVAVWPPPDVVDLIADTVARLKPRATDEVRWTLPEQWHVTLVFLGRRELDATTETFRRAPLPPGPVTATLGPETGRFGQRIVHVPAAGLGEVAAGVRSVLPGDDDRPFRGHVTLARVDARRRHEGGDDRRGRGRRRRVDLSSVVGVPLSASFLVTEVTLVVSRLGRGPAEYEVVDRLAL